MAPTTMTRILYMEDDPGLAVLLRKTLERRGFHVDTATNGEEGLKMAAATGYDVLLVDYNMPFLGGIDVIRALSEKNMTVPIIMVTGDGNEEVAVEALKLGASDYVVKDVEMRYLELLPAVIDQVLYKQQLIKERNQMQEAVRESEERYRSLVELAPDGIILHAGGTLLFANPAAARLLGAERPEDLVGRPVLEFVHPEFRDRVGERIRLLESQADCVPWMEEKLVRLDGRELEVEIAGAPFLYGGKPAVQEIFRDIKERKLAARRLEHLALYDGLTDLPNRSLFFDRLGHTLAVARRNGHLAALLFLDLDGFKQVNDSYGHDVGDELLKEVSGRITDTVRASDTVARMGGDEFTVILTKVQLPADPGIVAEKILTELGRPFVLQGHECRISASIGISGYPEDGDQEDVLLKKADTAMYRVKESGKRGYQFFSKPAASGDNSR